MKHLLEVIAKALVDQPDKVRTVVKASVDKGDKKIVVDIQ